MDDALIGELRGGQVRALLELFLDLFGRDGGLFLLLEGVGHAAGQHKIADAEGQDEQKGEQSDQNVFERFHRNLLQNITKKEPTEPVSERS